MSLITQEVIDKFDAILARGLCKGVGEREGQMCIEAAICAALNLPHGDHPNCVAPAVRSYKITLNDADWSSPEARARGLRDLGIAQIGSAGVIDGREFVRRLADKTIRTLIPALFREVFPDDQDCVAAASRCEQEGAAAAAAEAAAAAAEAEAEEAAAAAAAAAEAAAEAEEAAASAAERAAAAAVWAASAAGDRYLILSASLALDTLRELQSPGVEWIDAMVPGVKPAMIRPKTIPELAAAAAQITSWLNWERESLELFHAYAQRFHCPAGANVYLFVLEDALKTRGITLDRFKADMHP